MGQTNVLDELVERRRLVFVKIKGLRESLLRQFVKWVREVREVINEALEDVAKSR